MLYSSLYYNIYPARPSRVIGPYSFTRSFQFLVEKTSGNYTTLLSQYDLVSKSFSFKYFFFLSVSCLHAAFGETHHQPEMLSGKLLYCLQVQIIDKNLSFKPHDEDS